MRSFRAVTVCQKRSRGAARILVSILLAGVLSINLLGCLQNNGEQSLNVDDVATQTFAQQDLIADSKEKFGGEKYEYLPAMENVPRNQIFEFDLGFNVTDTSRFERKSQVVGFYADVDFSRALSTKLDITGDATTGFKAKISPPVTPPFEIGNKYTPPGGDEERISADPQDSTYLHYLGEYCDWGNAPRYYKVQWVDLQTGEPLEKPIVQIFTIQTELPAPKSEMYVDDRGKLSLRWEPVEGAEGYLIATEDYSEEYGRTLHLFNQDYVEAPQTEWHAPRNNIFTTGLSTLEYTYYDPPADGSNIYKESFYNLHIVVIAIGRNGHSSADKFHNTANLASHLTHAPAYELARAEGLTNSSNYNVGSLPAQYPVQMCDGKIVYKTIQYDFETAGMYTNVIMEAEELEDGTIVNPRNVIHDVFKISYSLEKTNIFGTYTISDPPANWEEELAKVKERQDALGREGAQNQIGGNIGHASAKADSDSGQSSTDSIEVVETEVFATSAMGNYLATNLLAGNTTIPMKDFPEAFDSDYLLDIFYEVYNQNPLILGVNGLSMDDDMNLIVTYQDIGEDRLRKQGEIQARVEEIIPQIITADMTAIDKELAINEYLCSTVEYDMEAYESAAESDFKEVDPQFNDTFTAYGALINGVSVCSGYAATFKLLANAAGLDAVVVTGTWAGGVGHAWNRVMVDGEWITVDSTNNDNPYLYNALFNLPDNISSKVLVEDEQYMADVMLGDYFATKDANEYYKLKGEFFGNEQIVVELAVGLADDGKVTLRTDYNLDEAGLTSIIDQVAELSGHESLYVDSLLGVITVSTTPA